MLWSCAESARPYVDKVIVLVGIITFHKDTVRFCGLEIAQHEDKAITVTARGKSLKVTPILMMNGVKNSFVLSSAHRLGWQDTSAQTLLIEPLDGNLLCLAASVISLWGK